MGTVKSHSRTILEGLLVAGAVTTVLLFGGFEKIEGWMLNTLFSLRGPIPPQSPIVMVSIDEDSFDELELQWPWPRSLHAQFLERLRQGNPAVIGFDILFIEPSRLGPEDDNALAEAVGQAGNVVLAAAHSVVQGKTYRKENLNPPIFSIRERATGYGPVNLPADNDAFIRRVQPIRNYQGKIIPGFDQLIYQQATKAGLGKGTFSRKHFLINYRGGAQTFETVPYFRVVNGEIPPAFFQGKIVLIGATSPLLHDSYPTPFAPQGDMPAVEIHANILETMLQNIPITRIPLWSTVLLLFLAGPLIIGLTNHVRLLVALGELLMLIGTYWVIGFITFTTTEMWLDFIPLPLTLVLGFGTSVIQNFVQTQREKRRLSQYFSPSILPDIIRHRSENTLGSQRRVVTILFCDIRGFTRLSQKMTPEDVATFLREYLTELTDAVFRHGGTIDKYIGDAIMALYNVPFDQPQHARNALQTAFEFQRRLKPLNKKMKDTYDWDLDIGIGIHTGEAIVGILGSQQRFEYTAIGDTINLGARLENLTKQYRVPIIMSEATCQEVGKHDYIRYLDTTDIRGREQPERIFTALETDSRREPRFPIAGHAVLEREGQVYRSDIINLSQGGIAVQNLPVSLFTDQRCPVRLYLQNDPLISISLHATVVWQNHQGVGFAILEMDPTFRAMMKDNSLLSEGVPG